MLEQVETLVIGAGVIGSSVAMHLAKMGMHGIRVIDWDLDGGLSSSELNAGGVRATWTQPINIQMSKESIEYFAQFAVELGYRPCGYLWLHSDQTIAAAIQARETQLRLGWPVELWDVAALKRKVPFLNKTADIVGCIYGSQDGLINPNLLKKHFRDEARTLGVVFDDRTWLMGVDYSSCSEYPIQAHTERLATALSDATKLAIASTTRQSQEMVPSFGGGAWIIRPNKSSIVLDHGLLRLQKFWVIKVLHTLSEDKSAFLIVVRSV